MSLLSGITSGITKGLTHLKTGAEEAISKGKEEVKKAKDAFLTEAITTAVDGLDPAIDKLCQLEIDIESKILLQNEIIKNLEDKLQKLKNCNKELKKNHTSPSASKAKYLKYKLKYLELKKKINTA